MTIRVYISDTSSDLQDLRPIIIQQIRAVGMTPVWLDETDKAAPDLPALIRRKLQTANCFIGVVSFLYGWQPAGGESLAEMEYNLAREQIQHIALFVPDPHSPLGKLLQLRAVMQPPGSRSAQRSFWQRVQSGGALTFHDETDLAQQLTRVLTAWSAMTAAPLVAREAAPAAEAAEDTWEVDEEVSEDTLRQPSPAPPPSQAAPPAPPPPQAAPGGSVLDRILRRDSAPLPEAAAAPAAVDLDALADQIADKTAARLNALQTRQQSSLAEQAVKVSEALRLWPGELVFGRPLKRKQFECDVFMVMPFAAEFSPVYTDVIRPFAAALNLRLLRGDELSSSGGSVMEEVWAALNACRFVIADISNGNDNVFYELGIAHTLNKPAILITQAAAPEAVPFDVRHLRYLRYEPTPDGFTRLQTDLQTTASRLLQELDEWER